MPTPFQYFRLVVTALQEKITHVVRSRLLRQYHVHDED